MYVGTEDSYKVHINYKPDPLALSMPVTSRDWIQLFNIPWFSSRDFPRGLGLGMDIEVVDSDAAVERWCLEFKGPSWGGVSG